MNVRTQEEIKKVFDKAVVDSKNGEPGRPLCFRGMSLPDADFSGRDLRQADFRNARLHFANFRGAKLKYANFESANLYGADFTDADMHRVNLKDANTSHTVMKPKDLFGVTVTLECKSFQDMELDPGMWWGWMMYMLLMKPPSDEARDRVIMAMGVERWDVLRKQYAVRQV